ncbi:cytochrome P450 4g15 isoform X2 [Rhodnius prolixus]|uniref:cytochrome P450 4g15 isoform X2 n=1 Tax=Rhodnius prolixus TaxID=13249 RepID=UPI003D18F62B
MIAQTRSHLLHWMMEQESIQSAFSATGMLMTLLVPVMLLYYLYYRKQRSRLYELADRIQGPPGYPFIGNALEFIGGADKVFNNVMSHSYVYENVIKVWVGPRLLIFLTNPLDIELILGSNVHIDKAPEYRYFEPWLGNGLLISTGAHWRAHRKLIAPTFHLNVLKSFIGLFNRNSQAVVQKLKNEVGKQFDCHDYMSETTVEILLETAMGVNKKTQESGFEYAMAVMKMCDILHLRQTKLWLRSDVVFHFTKYGKLQKKLLDTIHGLTKKVLKIRKEEYVKNGNSLRVTQEPDNIKVDSNENEKLASDQNFSFGHSKGLKDDLDVDDNDVGEKKRLAFLDLMIDSAQNGVVLTDEEIQNQVDTIMFEGHDTTAAGSSFFLCMMAARPDIQEKCMQEIDSIFGDSDRPVTFQDTLEMKYLERCIMETLRLYPPVPIIARELQKELKLASCDVIIPAKCTVIIATYKLHRREDIYPNAEHFDPDNFLPERSANRHYYSFIPFSAGPRSCVGRKYAMLKLKVLLATFLRNYRVLPGKPQKDWVLQADIILKRTDGFQIQVEPRRPTIKTV